MNPGLFASEAPASHRATAFLCLEFVLSWPPAPEYSASDSEWDALTVADSSDPGWAGPEVCMVLGGDGDVGLWNVVLCGGEAARF